MREFWLESISFLGRVVTKDGIMVDLTKILLIWDWARPTSPTEIWSFIGLAGYYWHFVEGFSSIEDPLIKLI